MEVTEIGTRSKSLKAALALDTAALSPAAAAAAAGAGASAASRTSTIFFVENVSNFSILTLKTTALYPGRNRSRDL
jgi:cation transporter-like permease